MLLLIGFLLAVIVSYIAYRARNLNKSGALAAAFIGTIVLGLGGWQWAVLLLAFFISSSALTRLFKNRKRELDEKYSKGGRRDAGQVFSNGGLATGFVLLHVFFPQAIWVWPGFAAALAAANADTWATELGVLDPNPPRLITNLRDQVERGTSGGVSFYGTCAALLGAALIGWLCAILIPDKSGSLFLLVTVSGLLGALFDSLLGATVQAIYFCPTDKKETEKHPLHTCGTPTIQIRGWNWLNNDLVNVACGVAGVLAAILLTILSQLS
jgi:uncharacterized protein (TIGR00297 family)